MRQSRGLPLRYMGIGDPKRHYDSGEIVVRNGQAKVSTRDDNPMTTAHWAPLGSVGATPTTVVHKWNPHRAEYPCGNAGEMSDPVDVCRDCWKDADYKNAFAPMTHLYVIRELGL